MHTYCSVIGNIKTDHHSFDYFTNMWTITRCAYLWAAILMAIPAHVESIREYDMENYCGINISLILDDVYQGIVKFEAEDLRTVPSVCEVNLESWYSWPRLMFYMDEFELDCSTGYLQLLDGISGAPIDGLNSNLCGTNIPRGIFSTQSQFLKLRYTAIRRSFRDDEFSLVFTSFSTDRECFEHKCTNGRCIHKDIVCGGYNPCGDDKDCEKGLTGAAVAGIVIGSLLGFACLVSIAVYVCCMKNKKSKPPQGSGNRPVVYTANPPPPQGRQPHPTAYQHPAYIGTHDGIISAQQPAYPVNFTCPIYQPAAPTAPPPYSEIYPNAPAGGQRQGGEGQAPPTEQSRNEEKPRQEENDYSNVTTLQVRGFRETKQSADDNGADREYAEPSNEKDQGHGYDNLKQPVDSHEYSKCET